MVGTPANSLNLTTAGLVKFDGVSVFSGVTTTLNRVLIGAASNGITSIAAGLTNQVLNGNTGSAPSFGTVPAGALPGSGQITLSNGTNISVTGSPVSLGGAATINVSGPPSATTLTNHGVVIGQATSAVVATAAGSVGQVLQSGGASADPSYSTATYPSTATGTGTILRADGTNWVPTTATYPSTATGTGTILRADGTNWVPTTATYPTTTTAGQLLYSSSNNVVGGLTSANNGTLVTNGSGTPSILAGPGTTGNVLQSNAAAAPSFSTATYPSTATGTGKILRADGTNWVASTATYPDTAGTAGKVLISDGTNIVSSTPTFPNASASSGKFIQSDGTNWVASTPTLPTSAGTSGKVLQSNGTNYVESTPTYPSTSGTARKIIVSDGTNNVYSTETWAVPGTSGNVLTSDGTNWTSAASGINALSTVSEIDDFIYSFSLSGTTANFGPWEGSCVNATIATSADLDSASPGVVVLGTGSSSTSRSVINKGSASSGVSTGGIIVGGGTITLQFRIKLATLSTVSETYTARFGLANLTNGSGDPTNGFWFQYTNAVNSGKWTINTSNAGTPTNTNSNSTVDTNWNLYKIVINAAGTSAAFYINGVEVTNSPLTTNFPVIGCIPAVKIEKTNGSTSRTISADLYMLDISLTTPR